MVPHHFILLPEATLVESSNLDAGTTFLSLSHVEGDDGVSNSFLLL